MSKKRAFARYTKKGQLVPGSLVVTTKGGYPDKTSLWKEVPTSFLNSDYGDWKLITGGAAGDGQVVNLGNDEFSFIGPNNNQQNGWVYLKRYYPNGANLSIDYLWTSFDEGLGVDWPVYWQSTSEPIGAPEDTTVRAESTPEQANWNVVVNPGKWFAIGIYSNDSCCGRGFLTITVDNL